MKKERAVLEYPAVKKRFDRFYLCLVIFSVAVFLLSLYLAIGVNSKIGISIALADGAAYAVITSALMKWILGIGYTLCGGDIYICIKGGSSEIGSEGKKHIPKRLMGFETTAIVGGAKTPDAQTEELYIYRGLERIEADAFKGMTSLQRIIFEGTEEEWSKIDCKAEIYGISLEFLGENGKNSTEEGLGEGQ